MNTKKLLVAYDDSRPNAGKSDFLAVVFEGGKPVFWGLRSRRIHASGRMVFIGREITEKDIFARLVDSGRKIESVDETLKILADYLRQIHDFKIGNTLAVTAGADGLDFSLVKLAERPEIEVNRLPLP